MIWNNRPIISKVHQNPMGKALGVGRCFSFQGTEEVAETRKTEGTLGVPFPVEGTVGGHISRKMDRPCRPHRPRRPRRHRQYPETVRNHARLGLV